MKTSRPQHRIANQPAHGKAQDRRGAQMVEFAFTLPVFILVVMAMITFGFVMFLRNSMLIAARDAARQLAVAGATVEDAEQLAHERLTDFNVTFTVTSHQVDETNPDDVDVWVEISTPISELTELDPMALLGDTGYIVVRATMRKEE